MRNIFLFFCIMMCGLLEAKWSIGYYPYPYSKLEITTNPTARFYGGMRLQTNSFVSNINTDFSFNWNFRREEKIHCFVGLGSRINFAHINSNETSPYFGQFIAVGARIYPFESLKPLGISFDVSPYFNRAFNSGRLESNLGLFWCFGRE